MKVDSATAAISPCRATTASMWDSPAKGPCPVTAEPIAIAAVAMIAIEAPRTPKRRAAPDEEGKDQIHPSHACVRQERPARYRQQPQQQDRPFGGDRRARANG